MKEFAGGTFGLPCALVLRYLAEGDGARQAEAQRDPARARHRFVTHDLLALTEELCAIPSVSGNEAALADVVEARLRARAPGHCGSSASAPTSWPAPNSAAIERIVLGGHLDTVPANGNATPRRDGDVLHGLGTADMKGGLAVLLALADDLALGRRARFDVTLVLYEGEEVADEHNGLRRLFAETPELVAGDLAILLEPTGGWVEAGCQGTIHVRAIFDGVRAHSARPWMGKNAIHRVAPLLERCAAFERRPSTSIRCCTASRCRSCGSRAGSRTTSCPIGARWWSTAATRRHVRSTTPSPRSWPSAPTRAPTTSRC